MPSKRKPPKTEARKPADIQIGKGVRVKAGIKAPEWGDDMSGWQGRVIAIENDMIDIAWDSLTLKAMPPSMIETCETKGWDWAEWRLGLNEVEAAKTRDTLSDVEKVKRKIASRYGWTVFGEQGKRIQKVLAKMAVDEDLAPLDAWREHLEETLSFPFEAVITESFDRGPLRWGDKVKVTGINDQVEGDSYGLIADLRVGHRKYAIPLCELEATDKKSANYQPVKDYAVWFANHG